MPQSSRPKTATEYCLSNNLEKRYAYLAYCDAGDIETPVNTAPVAQSDAESTGNGLAITIDVLSNDADGDTLTITSVSDAQLGTAEITDGVITCTPNELAMETDTLTYEISDGESTASGSVEIQQTQSVALSGIVTDNPLTNVVLSVEVGDTSFTTTAVEAGRFEITVRASVPDALVSFVGQAVDAQPQVTLTSNGGTFTGLLFEAMLDGERDLNDSESDLTKVSQMSTAQTLLNVQKIIWIA